MAEIREYGNIINPIYARYSFEKGGKITGSFRYSNAYTDIKQNDFVTFVRFIFQKDGVPTIYNFTPPELINYDMVSWVEVQDKNFTLSPGQTKEIHYSISIPNNAQEGGKYAVIIVAPQSEVEQLQGSGSKITAAIGFPLIGRVEGKEIMNSEIISFTSDFNIYFKWPSHPITFTTTLRNTGNVDYLPGGDIFVHQESIKNSVFKAEINPNDLVILPNNSRSFKTEWSSYEPLFRFGNNGVFINFDYFRIGKYTATAKIGYDVEGNRVVADRQVTFWILPLPLIIAILTIILVSSIGIAIWKKRQKHRQKSGDKKSITS